MNRELRYIDLFAGIGGFRIALDNLGAKCVFSSEIDQHAIEMYLQNFSDNSHCDITKLDPSKIPDFDILCAGFPCQSFSVCGKQKGFADSTRGTLFFDICKVLKYKKPEIFILENVKNLKTHDKGNTLFIMIKALNELGYCVEYRVLNARDFGVPQNRERIIIVGNRSGKLFDFNKIKLNKIESMYEFLDKKGNFEFLEDNEYTLLEEEHIKSQKSGLIFSGYRNKKIRTIGVRNGTEHLSRVHKQPNRIYSALGIHPTIASQEQSGRYWILVNNKVRKLTINECFRFMGFPNDFKKIGALSKLYERIGNSVCVPMIQEVAKEIINQFILNKGKPNMNIKEYLENIYKECSSMKDISTLNLTNEQMNFVKNIVNKEETLKGVYTVLVSSLIYKTLNPTQDIRYHQANLRNGYSGRTFDTKYVTPFLKQKQFLGAMKESGWLTRSLEQNLPYDLNYPGKISNKLVKQSFLGILNDLEIKHEKPEKYLKAIFYLSIKEKEKKSVKIINPIKSESSLNINEIIKLLKSHFYYPYKSRGASILPVVALYSIYECIICELKRFDGKKLQALSSHYSCDKSSGNAGDVVVLNSDNTLYEVIEVKFDIKPNCIMLNDAYHKLSDKPIQRYYILSTLSVKDEELEEILDIIANIRKEHGCQVIINGIFATLRYYLRLLENTDKFIKNYVKNIEQHSEINEEHKLAWNNLVSIEQRNNS